MSRFPVIESPYQTSWDRIAFAIIWGSMVPAAVLMFPILFTLWLDSGFSWSPKDGWLSLAASVVFQWGIIALSTAVAIIVVASSPWVALHLLGYRNWYAGAALGAITTNIAFFLLTWAVVPWGLVWMPILLAIWGGCVGWFVWWLAYDLKEPSKADQT